MQYSLVRRPAQSAVLLLLLACSVIPLLAQRTRISTADNGRRTVLPGQVPPRVALSEDRGRIDPSERISNVTLAFAPTAGQQTALDQFLVAQQTPGLPDYHRWLTPEQFAERFGISESDLATIRAWLESQGLTTGTQPVVVTIGGVASASANLIITQ